MISTLASIIARTAGRRHEHDSATGGGRYMYSQSPLIRINHIMHGLRPQILATDKDSQTSDLPTTSLFFSHGRQDFGGEDAPYLSKEDFEKLRSSEEETSLGVGLKS